MSVWDRLYNYEVKNMASVTVSGFLNCSDGTVIPLQNTSQAEGTEFTLQTNATYTVSQQNVGDYAPGRTIISGSIQAPNGISYAYILRQGLVAAILPVSIKGTSGAGGFPLCAPFTLQPGDQVRCLHLTATARNLAVCVYTNRGVSRIFTVTPSGAATNEPVDLQTGNSVGDTLQGQVVTKAFVTSVDGSKIDGGGCLMLNEAGTVSGAIPANNPINSDVYYSMVSIPCALNYAWTVVTTS
jgi:hypothetical protein